MPQIMIDTDASSPAHLRMTAKFLEDMAESVERGTRTDGPAAPAPAAPSPEVPPAPKFGAPLPTGASPTPIVVPPAPPPPVVPSGTVEVPPPPSPPAPSVQTAATPAVPPVTSGADPVELDSEGFPYDARIHGAGENRKKKTGEWKYRRGIDNALIQTVEAELRAKGYGVKPTAAPTTPPPPPLQLAQSPAPPPPPSVLVPPAPAAGVGAIPPPPPASVPNGADAFRNLMKKIAPHMAPNGKLALTVLTPIYTKLGVKGLEDFAKPGAPIDQMNAEVDAILGVA